MNPSPPDVHLPVLKNRPARRRIPRWRIACLVAVNLLILAHILHWKLAGQTMASCQLSDAMHTLELGEINPGFVLFGLALLITLVFGRFFCGWACHMGALQDACGWLLRRCGIRPAPLRSRFLGYIPILLALYMFIWPSLKRGAILPLLESIAPSTVRWFKPVASGDNFSAALTTSDLWERLPGAMIAVPFFLICGCATVYFLGARGLCRFGCPYAGLFKPVAALSLGGVVVDPARCDGCGLCTAACGQNVRVLDETRSYGAVIDPACIRSLDCLAACPQNALSLRSGPPVVVRRIRNASVASVAACIPWTHDSLLLAAFALSFFILRGLYSAIPMLMAVGMALCVSGICWQAMRLIHEPNVAFRRLQFKRAGRLRLPGRVLVGVLFVTILLLSHSAGIRLLLWRARILDDQIIATRDEAIQGLASQLDRERASRAECLYRAASSWTSGGFAMFDSPEINFRCAWLQMVQGHLDQAQATLTRALTVPAQTDAAATELASLRLSRGDMDGTLRFLLDAHASAARPVPRTSRLLAGILSSLGDPTGAERVLCSSAERWPDDAAGRAALGEYFLATGRAELALPELDAAATLQPRNPATARLLAVALQQHGQLDAALAQLRRAARLDTLNAEHDAALGTQWLAASGRAEESVAWSNSVHPAPEPPKP